MTHPHTGLTLIGTRRDGRPIYLARGGSTETPAAASPAGTTAPVTTPPAPTGTDPAAPPALPAGGADDKPLGPGGEKALAAEREARKALEKQLAELSPLKQLAAALAGGQPADGMSEVDLLKQRFAEHEKTIAQERDARWRAEVAHEKGLTPQQAERLRGTTREEIAADADALLELFPAAAAGPRTPAPDPSQGFRGTSSTPDLEGQIAEAQRAGDYRKVIALQRQKLQTTK